MNQILLTNNNYNNNNNNNNNSINNNNNPNNLKKIIIVFSIIILVFGIAMIALYSYKVIKKNNNKGKEVAKPELYIEQNDEQVKIITKSSIGIDLITYTWNDEEPIEIEVNASKEYEEQLEIPQGSNTLTVEIKDIRGQINSITKEFSIETTAKPIIETKIQEDARLKIIATVSEESKMAYITYKWNDEEETTVNSTEESDTKIEVIIDVKRGENTLTVTAVNDAGNSETIRKKFKGINNPVITVSQDGTKLNMKMSHDLGFKKIEFYVNGQTYVYDENFAGYDASKQEIQYSFDLQVGENIVIIVATSIEGTQSVYQGKCNYTPQ